MGGASRGFARGFTGLTRLGKATESVGAKVGGVIGGFGFIGGIASLLWVATQDPRESEGLLDWSIPAGTTAVLLFRICVGLAGVYVAGLIAMIGFGVLGGVLYALVEPLAEARRSIEWAERHKQLRASTEAGIDKIRGRITTISRRVFSPRLYVVGVHSRIWQYTIRGFAADVDVPLIDISEPTDNVLWEVRTILHWFGPRTVVVGEYERLGRLFDHPVPGRPVHTVMRLLDGVEVLGYTTDSAGQRRFATALRHKLDDHVTRPMPQRS